MTDLLTVITPTIGDASGHLNRAMIDLRQFTSIPFRQIVSDDGTLDAAAALRQAEVCAANGALWTVNPGPTYGVSYNLNHAMRFVETPWAFILEDGLRAGYGWLETAIDAIKRIGRHSWMGHSVGMMGTSSFDDWHLALAGVLPTDRPWQDFAKRSDAETYSAFWGGEKWPNWNDGLWCWRRLLPLMKKVCESPEADGWPSPHPGHFRDVIRGTPLPSPYGLYADQLGYRPLDSWPSRRHAHCGWFPGAFMLVNMDAWRAVGRFRDGCTFFEGHLGIRMAMHGYLSLCLEFPPWSHYSGMGFVTADRNFGKKPRHHEPCDGPGGLLEKDFGCNGDGHADLYKLVYATFPPEKQAKIDAQLREVKLFMRPEWKVWE